MDKDEFDRRMTAWHQSERAAMLAEHAMHRVGQAGNSPELAHLALEAADLRRKADELLAALLSSMQGDA